MKKLLLILAFVVGAQVTMWAQSVQSVDVPTTTKRIERINDKRWTVDLSAGIALFQELFLSGVHNEEAIVPGGTTHRNISNFALCASADVYYRFSDRFSLGLRTTLGHKQIECFNGNEDLLGRFVGLPTTVVLTSKLSYFVGSEFEFYGLYGLGTTLMIVLEDYYWRPAPVVKVRNYFADHCGYAAQSRIYWENRMGQNINRQT